ncbi:MAG: KpsF/GutQ family sugar-phosphate isomerase [Candidatus Cloacimonetes bacterium]|nr:KpsF/GutQ family sugar-phosphate isomerase [Candidatus Cloacimonadota bacterium]
MNNQSIVEFIRLELITVSETIKTVSQRINNEVAEAIDLIYNSRGKIVVTGMGKTGIIARKIAATLASTGTSAIFLHAAEGIHGDLGMINKDDVIIAISYSGNSSELLSIIPYFKFLKLPIIALTGNVDSNLAKSADIVVNCNVPKDIEPFGLVPTVSTTVTLAIGDAIAVALLKKRDFKINDYALFHPGGTIGKKLLLRVGELMHSGKSNPLVNETLPFKNVIMEMTTKGLGCANVVDDNEKLSGIITDGDLRRLLSKEGDILSLTAREMMKANPKKVTPETLAVEALNLMEKFKITMLPVVNEDDLPVGLLHMHDLIRAGVV